MVLACIDESKKTCLDGLITRFTTRMRPLLMATPPGLPVALLPSPAAAQAQSIDPPENVFSQEQLDPLRAPIAPYRDALLTRGLMAAACPLEVTEAERFLKANPKLKGEALTRRQKTSPGT